MSTLSRTTAIAAALLLAACGSDSTGPTPLAPVHSITVFPGEVVVPIGTALDLEVTLYDRNDNVLTGRAISYGSENPQVATFTAAGRVVGVTAGTTRLVIGSEGLEILIDAEVVPVAPAGITPR